MIVSKPPIRTEPARLELRIEAPIKREVDEAASLLGLTTSAFVTETIVERAREVKRNHHLTVLYGEDREVFLRLLEAPPAENPALRRTLSTRADV